MAGNGFRAVADRLGYLAYTFVVTGKPDWSLRSVVVDEQPLVALSDAATAESRNPIEATAPPAADHREEVAAK